VVKQVLSDLGTVVADRIDLMTPPAKRRVRTNAMNFGQKSSPKFCDTIIRVNEKRRSTRLRRAAFT
jgi:hypothetical protein